jgi:hypothetical protein
MINVLNETQKLISELKEDMNKQLKEPKENSNRFLKLRRPYKV